MQFAPVHSFVDIPFFAELSKYKLEKAKLSDARASISGFVNAPAVADRPPAFHLSSGSFSEPTENAIPGELLNLNTIEEFKDLDKIALLKSEAGRLGCQIKDGSVLENPNLLASFLFLSFSDLKKYKFYYWLMFPALAWTSQASVLDEPVDPMLLQRLSGDKVSPVCIVDDGELVPLKNLSHIKGQVCLSVADFGSQKDLLPWHLRNVAALLIHHGFENAKVLIHRPSGSFWISLSLGSLTSAQWQGDGAQGWERNAQNRLTPKMSDVSSLMDPHELANQAVDLNLKLMKWRAAPQIDLDAISSSKCLLLGAGTLGSYIARGLMAWGVRSITFVDNGKVSYSNPVRQPLYVHEDCVEHAPKAETAAKSLKQIFPGVNAHGVSLEIPMLGHPIAAEQRQKSEYDQLVELISDADFVFLLMDSRESRWLPTVITQALKKTVVNVALGLDSYVVMRHGVGHNLGCYFCNDVVAPGDSMSRQTLDQMCTVTRPGCAMIAGGHAVELMATLCQCSERGGAPYLEQTVLGPVPHQLRGFLSTQEIAKVWGPAFPNCSACGTAVLDAWKQHGWEFVKAALTDEKYITELSGLGDLQRKTEQLDLDEDLEMDSEGLE